MDIRTFDSRSAHGLRISAPCARLAGGLPIALLAIPLMALAGPEIPIGVYTRRPRCCLSRPDKRLTTTTESDLTGATGTRQGGPSKGWAII